MGATLEKQREQTVASLADEARALAHQAHVPPLDPEMRDGLLAVVEVLSPSLTWRGIAKWFESPNGYLHGERPIDLVAQRRFSEVAEAADAFDEGTYL